MERQLCTFYIDGSCFAVDVTLVQEVLRHQEMTRVPLAHPVVAGLINLRGQIVTALDLRRRLEAEPLPPERLPMNVVTRSDRGVVSLLVDEIGDVLIVNEAGLLPPPPTLRGAMRHLVQSVYKLDGQLLLVLDLDRAVSIEPTLRH